MGQEQLAQNKVSEIMQPDFGNIIDQLRKENSIYVEQTNKAYGLVKSLKEFTPTEQKAITPEPYKEPVTIVDYLWQQINQLRNSNNELTSILSHLYTIVGS